MSGGRQRVLVVDDDLAVGTALGALLSQEGFDFRHVADGVAALQALEAEPYDAVVTDLRMPRMDGMTLLREVKRRWRDLPVIMMTAFGSVPRAVDAMKAGAAEFVLKPFDRAEILFVVRKALTTARDDPAEPVVPPGTPIVGSSRSMVEVQQLITRTARSDATVLVRGESGTGKELVARAIHERGHRSEGPLVVVPCSALPDTLLESELFGYEKGAFTGATQRKPGRLELAQGGTVFLDEIGDVTPAVQVKLLRVLQERQVERLGGRATVALDVRFVAATHRDLEERVRTGEFRADLYYRLNVVPIWLPPLRERGDDLVQLAEYFCEQHAALNGQPGLHFDGPALSLLSAQPWPGNVRQLQNFVERLVVLSDGPRITAGDVTRELSRGPAFGPTSSQMGEARVADEQPLTLDEARTQAERDVLTRTLGRCRQNRTKAARILGVSRRTLYNKLKEHRLG